MTLTRSQTNTDNTSESDMAHDIDSAQSNMAAAIDCTLQAANSTSITTTNSVLEKIVVQQGKLIQEMSDRIMILERKVDDNKLQLSTQMTAEAVSTVRVVNEFYRNLEAKVDNHTLEVSDLRETADNHKSIINECSGALNGLKAFSAESTLDALHTTASTNKSAIAEIQCILDNPSFKSRFVKTPAADSISIRSRNDALIQRRPISGEPNLINVEKRVDDNKNVNERCDIDVSADNQMNFECIKRLEQRIDGLEDHSRRDNLLFYGFPEQLNENCTLRVKDLIYNKILNSDYENDIKFVRAHRLGRYNPNSAKPRAIIVKFREFNERMDVFMSKKKLKGTPYAVTEDFSTNTNNEREFLEDCIKTAKLGLKGDMEAGFLRYKTLIIKDSRGKLNRFSANYINQHPQDWWMRARVINADEWRSQENVRKNRALEEFRQALVGDLPPADGGNRGGFSRF